MLAGNSIFPFGHRYVLRPHFYGSAAYTRCPMYGERGIRGGTAGKRGIQSFVPSMRSAPSLRKPNGHCDDDTADHESPYRFLTEGSVSEEGSDHDDSKGRDAPHAPSSRRSDEGREATNISMRRGMAAARPLRVCY